MLHEIPGPLGTLEALLDEPAAAHGISRGGLVEVGASGAPKAAVVLGHPHPQYGGTMHSKALYQASKALARIGCSVLRFNFRGVGRSAGAFDEGRGERDDFRAGLDFMRSKYPGSPVWAGGMSFGAMIGLTTAVEDPGVSALIGIAVPITRYDFEKVRTSAQAKFLIHGERDELFPVRDVREFYARAADPKELVVIDGADHVFDGKTGEVGDTIEDLLADWPG